MGCVALSASEWLFCIAVGATSLPVNFLVCMIKPEWLPTWTVSWQPGKAEDQVRFANRQSGAITILARKMVIGHNSQCTST